MKAKFALLIALAICGPGTLLAQTGTPDMTDEQKARTNLGPCLDDKTKQPISHAHIYRIDKFEVAAPGGTGSRRDMERPTIKKEVAKCACDLNYKRLGDACVIDQAKKKPNKAECMTIAGQRLKVDIKACESPVTSCLMTWGAQAEVAKCATGGLIVALAAMMSPEPLTKPIAIPAVGGALANCGFNVMEIGDKCSPAWNSCAEPHLAELKNAWDDKTQTCRARGP